MAEMYRVKVNWTGFVGGPGFTNFYFLPRVPGTVSPEEADAATDHVDTFLDAFTAEIPTTVTRTIDSTVDLVRDTDGFLMSFYQTTPPAGSTGTSAGVYSGVSGVCVNWITDGIRNGRRIRGRTFIVPLGQTAYDTDGTIGTTRLATFRAAAQTLIDHTTGPRMAVWSRPVGTPKAGGIAWPAEAVLVNDKVSVLTSRRD